MFAQVQMTGLQIMIWPAGLSMTDLSCAEPNIVACELVFCECPPLEPWDWFSAVTVVALPGSGLMGNVLCKDSFPFMYLKFI